MAPWSRRKRGPQEDAVVTKRDGVLDDSPVQMMLQLYIRGQEKGQEIRKKILIIDKGIEL